MTLAEVGASLVPMVAIPGGSVQPQFWTQVEHYNPNAKLNHDFPYISK